MLRFYETYNVTNNNVNNYLKLNVNERIIRIFFWFMSEWKIKYTDMRVQHEYE